MVDELVHEALRHEIAKAIEQWMKAMNDGSIRDVYL